MSAGVLFFLIAAIGALLMFSGMKGKLFAVMLIGLLLLLIGGYGIGVQML